YSRMKSLVRDERGISLLELVAALPLAVLVLVLVSMAVTNFLTTFEETKLYVQLQEELFQAVETMRYGYTKKGVTDEEGLIGLITANSVTIRPDRAGITIRPIVITQGASEDNYKADFYLTDHGRLKTSARYNLLYYYNQPVFPSGDNFIGKDPQFKITSLRFTPEIASNDGRVFLLGIEIEAMVRFRERASQQTANEDIRLNTKKIKYKTSVLLGNT
ncbi:MAG: hypothetical protein JXB60_08545, partial [Candidatus Cloacimonetes bacterium]|nr:hypothetical protein [Candidatus Cloacimonadota bacterium]